MEKIMWEVNFGAGQKYNVIARNIKESIDKSLKNFKWNNGDKGELSEIIEVKLIGEEG